MGRFTPIEDYAAIGNLRSVVLVSKDGSIDWAPAPFIDSPSVFGALLDREKGGFWQIAPEGAYTASQSYCKDTNVVETRFKSGGSELLLTDYMPLEKHKTFVPAEENVSFRIVRKVTSTKGTCSVRMKCAPRFDYGRGETSAAPIDEGVRFSSDSFCGVLLSKEPLEAAKDHAHATFELAEGESRFFVFRYNGCNVWHESDMTPDEYDREIEETKVAWRTWAHSCDLDVCPVLEGDWEDAIRRSLLVLRLLFFEPVGTVAAAATTSLPEEIGGVRNWDYRFTWLRDASFTFQALFKLGHFREAKEYLRWVLGECKRTNDVSQLRILYPLYGERNVEEEILPHLDGYEGSQPVRIGNGAYMQNQWDIYGSILSMVWELHEGMGHAVVDDDWPVLAAIADHVTRVWQEPDEGLWEVRGGANHFVYSKVMCFVALDRACKLAEAYGYEIPPAWPKARDAIQDAVYMHGWSKQAGTFVQRFDGTELDVALLRLSAVGFIEGDDPRMIATIDAIERHLYCADGLMYRYTTEDGLPGQEGAFLLSSFWFVDALALAGKRSGARELFNKLLSLANHVGLYAEEIDPGSGRFLGNFPQAYTHIGLINSALLLTELEGRKGS